MKKLLALVLALALCCALVACGQDSASAPDEKASAGATIPKPDAAASAAETPAPAAADKQDAAPAQTEPPAAPAADIEVTDLCAIMGTHAQDAGYVEYYSFTLPRITGPDTPYIQALNADMQGVYDDYVCAALDALEEYDSLPHYCACYQYAVKDGIHSLLVSCDTDWGQDMYWCYNFDDAGNEVENAAVLKAAGLTEDAFVAAARDYFTEITDLSEYFEDGDESWKELQEQTVADDNCNAAMPMAILPGGKLCFIGTIYTLAGAGVYDRALELDSAREIRDSDIGLIFMNRLSGDHVVRAAELGLEDDDFSYLLSFFTVGDTLSVEVTAFSEDTGSVMYYYAADIFADDPAALLRGDVDSVRVRVLPYCPDVFGGSYYGEPGVYTLTATGDSVSFTDFGGGTPLLGDGEDFTATYTYGSDLGLDDVIPDTDYDLFDFDAVEEAGLAGVWSGYYHDEDYQTHTLTLEMTRWGGMTLRDCAEGAIPRVLDGSYYIAAEDGEYPEGAVVFNLVARGGYKMPVFGFCDMFVDDDGDLLIDDALEGAYSHLTQCDEDYYCVLYRVPEDRRAAAPQVRKLEEDESVSIDFARDGEPEEFSFSLLRDKEAGDAITDIEITLDGAVSTLSNQWFYDMDVYLIEPGYGEAAFLYFDGLSDNDYHYLQVVGVKAGRVWYAGDFFGGFAETPSDIEAMRLDTTLQFLSTAGVERTYRLGAGGMPEAVEPFFRASGGITLTAKRDLDVWTVTPDTGILDDFTTLEAGTEVRMLRSDGGSFWDLQLGSGEVCRVWIDTDGWPQTVDGVDIEECFDGVRFAG